jgi:hypothetical protein
LIDGHFNGVDNYFRLSNPVLQFESFMAVVVEFRVMGTAKGQGANVVRFESDSTLAVSNFVMGIAAGVILADGARQGPNKIQIWFPHKDYYTDFLSGHKKGPGNRPLFGVLWFTSRLRIGRRKRCTDNQAADLSGSSGWVACR